MWMLIWYNIARRRAQAVLTIVITFLTIMSFVLVLGIFQVMKTGIRLSQDRLGADVLLVPQEATVDDRELLFSAIPENIYMDSDILMDVAEFDGIAAMSPQFYSQTLDSSCCDTGREIRIIGFDQDTDFILKPYLAQSESGPLEEEPNHIRGEILETLSVNAMSCWRTASMWWDSCIPQVQAWMILSLWILTQPGGFPMSQML